MGNVIVELSILLYTVHVVCYDVLPREETYLPDYAVYHNVSSITEELMKLTIENKRFMHLNLSFKSRLNHSQFLLHLTDHDFVTKDSSGRKKILLSFGEHAREFLPVESILYFLQKISYQLNDETSFYRRILMKVCSISYKEISHKLMK